MSSLFNIYDSLSAQNQYLSSNDKQPIRIYLCGPTVYDDIHLGNARPAITMDLLHRFLLSQNQPVDLLQNITDIDDKIINKAATLQQSESEVANRFTLAYQEMLRRLKVLPATKTIPISKRMETMINFIKDLVDKGDAYEVNGNVYFRLGNYQKAYGKLGKRDLDELIAGERVNVVSDKEDPLDFVLWKKTDKGQKWLSPWGEGRPGWHTECVVLIDDYFHQPIDIHAGGIDLKFPHHENERVQYLAKNNQDELAKIWMHNGHLNIDSTKMSKSLGNVVLVKNFLKKHHPDVLRWIFMSVPYKQPLNLTADLINQGEKFRKKLLSLRKHAIQQNLAPKPIIADFAIEDPNLWHNFIKAMSDDLDTPKVLTILEQGRKVLNQGLDNGLIWSDLAPISDEFVKILAVLGMDNYFNLNLSPEDINLYHRWQAAITAKDYQKADELRKQLQLKEIV